MSAADVNGTVTYAGLEKVFADLATTLSAAKTALTAAEMSDLKTIATDLNIGETASSYLTGVTNALVNGNAANATWTGGAASSTTLGNLATGASATQLTELIGKWFLGTDLPSSKVAMSGESTFSISYTTSAGPLFAASGPSMNDINQGYLGDCYLLSGLAEVAKQNSSDITSMITSNGNGTYGVRFFENGQAQYVTVNSSLANGGSVFNAGTDIWASLVEKAYAQLQTGGAVTGNSVNYGNSYSTIGNGGQPFYALEEITGASQLNYFGSNGSSWADYTLNSSFQTIAYSAGMATSSLLTLLKTDLAKGDDVILSSNTNAADSSGKQTLVADHAMSIYGYDSATNMLEVRNPWGAESGQYWDTTFEVSLATLQTAGDAISVDNMGTNTAPTTPSAPTLTSQTGTQTWKLGQAVSFTLPTNTFTDPQAQKLTYTATQANGSALPSWLTFNAATGAFTGTVPNTAAGLSLKVTATDTSGLSTFETFSVLTPATAPTLSSQTAAQTWKLGQAVSFTLPTNTFTDPQGEKLTYTATQASGSALPSWLTFNATTGTFSGTVANTATGMSLKVTATDTSGLSVSETIGVSTVAAAPTVTSLTKAQGLTEGKAFSIALPTNTFVDPQGEKLTYSAKQTSGSALPTWLTFNAATDTFSGTAPTTASTLSLKVTAIDTSGLSVAETFSTVVNTASLLAQAIASAPASAAVTSALTQLVSAPPTTLASSH